MLKGCVGFPEVVARYLEHVTETSGIVDVDVGHARRGAVEERQLEIPEGVARLEAAGGCEAVGWLVERAVDRPQDVAVHQRRHLLDERPPDGEDDLFAFVAARRYRHETETGRYDGAPS